jgi:hypothetical protein
MSFDEKVKADFSHARFLAHVRDLVTRIWKQPNELLSFEEVRRAVHANSQHYAGLQTVEVNKIIGTTGRYQDFDRAFLPKQDYTADRWQSIDRAYYQAIELPPVSLYKVGDVYFVRDGHHRVSVARQQGVQYIDAEVIESESRVPVTPDLRPEDLVIKGEYADFLEETKLDRLRPDQKIEFSTPGGYRTLLEHIAVHRYFLGQESGREVSQEEAVTSWYDNLYLPVVEVIRLQNVLADFPNRTEVDLYLWIMDHLYYLREQYGSEVSPEEAVTDFTEQFSQKPGRRLGRNLHRAVEALEEAVEEILPLAPLTEECPALPAGRPQQLLLSEPSPTERADNEKDAPEEP